MGTQIRMFRGAQKLTIWFLVGFLNHVYPAFIDVCSEIIIHDNCDFSIVCYRQGG